MPPIYTERDDAACEALALRLAAACADYSNADVACELLIALGECIGRAPLHNRPLLVQGACAELRQYVSEIPPLASDGPHAA